MKMCDDKDGWTETMRSADNQVSGEEGFTEK